MAASGHTRVAVFSSFGEAMKGIHSLEVAGFDPSQIEVVAGDERAASEVAARTYGREGFFGGLIVGLLLVLAAVFIGGLSAYPVASIVGSVGVIGGLAVIGLVLGRALERRAPDAPLFAAAVRDGGAVISVDCGTKCDIAERLLHESGAADVRDESAPRSEEVDALV
jgi:hypothetical protein